MRKCIKLTRCAGSYQELRLWGQGAEGKGSSTLLVRSITCHQQRRLHGNLQPHSPASAQKSRATAHCLHAPACLACNKYKVCRSPDSRSEQAGPCTNTSSTASQQELASHTMAHDCCRQADLEPKHLTRSHTMLACQVPANKLSMHFILLPQCGSKGHKARPQPALLAPHRNGRQTRKRTGSLAGRPVLDQ